MRVAALDLDKIFGNEITKWLTDASFSAQQGQEQQQVHILRVAAAELQ